MIAHWKMQKCLKFQYQSRDLEKKLLFILFTIGLLSSSPQIFAEEDLGLLVEQQNIVFEVGMYSDIHVKHIIEAGVWGVDNPRIIEILPGTHKNLVVADEDGDRLDFSFDGETFEDSKYVVLNQKLLNYDLVVEYDLENYLEIEKGLWKKNIQTPFDIIIMFDEDIEMIFVNSRPVDMTDAEGINCVGCNLFLEFYSNVKELTKEISFNDEKHTVKFFTNGEISDLEFVEQTQIMNFVVDETDQIIIMEIPFSLLLNPFEVYFTEEGDTELDQIDKIRKTEFSQNESYVNLSFRTVNEGIISITGSSIVEHNELLEKIEKRVPTEKITEVMEVRDVVEDKQVLSFADNLEKSENSDLEDYTIIAIIIVIIAAIIIGVIVKIKRN